MFFCLHIHRIGGLESALTLNCLTMSFWPQILTFSMDKICLPSRGTMFTCDFCRQSHGIYTVLPQTYSLDFQIAVGGYYDEVSGNQQSRGTPHS